MTEFDEAKSFVIDNNLTVNHFAILREFKNSDIKFYQSRRDAVRIVQEQLSEFGEQLAKVLYGTIVYDKSGGFGVTLASPEDNFRRLKGIQEAVDHYKNNKSVIPTNNLFRQSHVKCCVDWLVADCPNSRTCNPIKPVKLSTWSKIKNWFSSLFE